MLGKFLDWFEVSFPAWQKAFVGMALPSHWGETRIKGEEPKGEKKLISGKGIGLRILYVSK